MPIVVIHASAADQLQPAANAGNFATGEANQKANLAVAEFQAQEDLRRQALDQAAADHAQQRALEAAAEVDRRRTAQELQQTRRDIAGAANDTTKQVAGVKAQTAVNVANLRGQQLGQSAAERTALADHVSQLHIAEQKAAQEQRYQDAAALQKQRVDAQQKLDASREQFRAKAQAIAQDFAERQQGKRVQAAAGSAANRYEFNRLKTMREQKLQGLNTQIQQLQHQAAATEDNKQRHAAEAKVEQLMEQYRQAAAEYDQWLSSPPALPARSAATQPTTQAIGPRAQNKATGEWVQWNGTAWERVAP